MPEDSLLCSKCNHPQHDEQPCSTLIFYNRGPYSPPGNCYCQCGHPMIVSELTVSEDGSATFVVTNPSQHSQEALAKLSTVMVGLGMLPIGYELSGLSIIKWENEYRIEGEAKKL
jgi:hypothetical protein